ncbi:MAG: peptide deformylase [Candidatus Liptonbacteria bacterium]|nr:peptide deformylase [Candidatus Liptonbacteria bacterium]
MKIITIAVKSDEKFLRQKAVPFDFSQHGKKEVNELISRMRRDMMAAEGIGLAANQIGLNFSVFVARVPDKDGRMKFYALFNPEIEKKSAEKIDYEEGCLSVPKVFGSVERPEKITLVGQDKNGGKVKFKAWGLLARVFQHEVDHLDGVLFIDKAKKVHTINIQDQDN